MEANYVDEESLTFAILNHRSGETVCFPLVLLEGSVADKPGRSPVRKWECEIDAGHRAAKVHIQETTRVHDEVLVGGQGDEFWRWPVVEGGFKALVPLNVGKNIITLSLSRSDDTNASGDLEFVLNYEPFLLTRYVRVVYIKCSDGDGTFQAPPGVKNDIEEAIKRLSFNARLLQTFMAESLYQHGLGHHTFRLEEDEAGNPKVHVFTSKLTMSEALKMNGDQLYKAFLTELQTSNLYDPMYKLWSFMSCTRYIPPPPDQFSEKDVPKYAKAHTALGGGNLALFGTGGLHTWASSLQELVPCFCDTSLVDKMQLFDDSGGRGTFWANYATGLGASMHELGHCFDLAHTPDGIMARGFDDMNCVFTMWRRPRKCATSHADSSMSANEADDNGKEPSYPSLEQWPSDLPKTKTIAPVPSAANQPGVQGCTPVPSLQPGSPQSNPPDNPGSGVVLSQPGNWSHGARWHRSSAVLLRYHKWLTSTETSQETTNHTMVHWSRDTCGPVGSCLSSHEEARSLLFDSAKWLDQSKARLGGFIIYAGEYINCLQIVGHVTTAGENEECKEVVSEPYGTPDVGQRYAFTFADPDERLLSVDVRAGAWIDAVRFHTNKKSSVWMGGSGGNLHQLKAPPGREIRGLFGTSGTFVTSLGAVLHSDSNANSSVEITDQGCVTVEAPLGIRLIELQDKKHGEVERHWEFLSHDMPRRFTIPRTEVVDKACTIQVEDDRGSMFRSATCPSCYSQVLG